MPERDDFDRLLDSALSTYAEPRNSLERRIHARVMAHVGEARGVSLAPRRHWLVWGVAVPLTACIAIYVSISGVRRPQTNNPPEAPKHEQRAVPTLQSAQRQPLPSVARSQVKAASRSILHRNVIAAAHAPRPKLDVFPAPQPLSTQEQALIALAQQSPELQQKVLARTQQDDMPLEISVIQIPPISTPDEGKN